VQPPTAEFAIAPSTPAVANDAAPTESSTSAGRRRVVSAGENGHGHPAHGDARGLRVGDDGRRGSSRCDGLGDGDRCAQRRLSALADSHAVRASGRREPLRGVPRRLEAHGSSGIRLCIAARENERLCATPEHVERRTVRALHLAEESEGVRVPPLTHGSVDALRASDC
jgi:hypothetical protein